MRRTSSRVRRRGATAVEFAIVGPITFFLILGLIVGGMGIFRYQEVARLAREAARYASVHGGQYAKENAQAIQQGTLPNVNVAYITNNVVTAQAVSLDSSALQVTVTINTPNGAFDWDNTAANNNRNPYAVVTQGANTTVETTTVSVTVTYQWIPELYLVGPITLTSTSVMPMAY